MDTGNISQKNELDNVIFLGNTGIGTLKYNEIRVSDAKLSLLSILY